MNLIKRLMPLMAAMAMAFSTSAALQYVVVNDSEGGKTVLALEDKPTVTFTGAEMVITAGEQTLSIPLTDKVSFTFSEDATGIDQILSLPQNILFSWNGQSVEIAGLKPLSKVSLYQADGKMLTTVGCDNEGRVCLDIQPYKGVIIISTEAKAFKIAK